MHDCWEKKCESVISWRIKFGSLLRKNESADLAVSRQANLTESSVYGNRMDNDPVVLAIKKKFAFVFKDDLPHGLPQNRDIFNEIETHLYMKPPHRPIFELSPAKLKATKTYVTDLLQIRTTAPVNRCTGPLSFSSNKKSNVEESPTTVRLIE